MTTARRQSDRILPRLAAAAVAAQLTGCNPEDEKVFKSAGNREGKPERTLLQGGEGLGGLDATTTPAKAAARIDYKMFVTSNSGTEVCNGDVTVELMTDFSLKTPAGTLQCASLTVNLAGMLGGAAIGQSAVGSGAASADGNITHDGMVLSVKSIANAQFEPPRPMLLGPVVQEPQKYAGFTRSSDHTLSGSSPATGQPVSGSGRFSLKVLAAQTTYENKFVGKAFDKVLHWEMRAEGFQGVPAATGLVFQRIEFLWNVRPIMIPKIVIEGQLSDFMGGSPPAGMRDLTGTMKVELIVTKFDMSGG